jgi:hypothetical protein
LIRDKKNTFQSADPTILPETPQIPSLSGEHGRWLKSYFPMIDIEFLNSITVFSD